MTDNETEKKDKKAARKATAGDLKRARVTVVIKQIDGEELEIDLTMLSRWKINQIRSSLLPNGPPLNAANPYTKNAAGEVKPVYDYSDPGYLMHLADVETRRNYKVLLAMMPEGFIPGDTENEQLDFMQNELDAALTDQLFGAISGVFQVEKARIEQRAETF